MDALAKEIGDLLRRNRLTLGAVESATGGLISHLLTNISGSSEYYQGSITSYSNEIKMRLVGVKKETLEKYGSVSAKVAEEMADGGRITLGVDVCIADTGIAGPTGATKNKPIGLFYLGLSCKEGTYNRRYVFHGNREQNKEQAANAALAWLKEFFVGLNSEEKKYARFQINEVVTCFLESGKRILLLRRSAKVGTYQGQWAGVSGYIERNADEQALVEIQEETGLNSEDVALVSRGAPIEVIDNKLKVKWMVHPFLFHVNNPIKIKIDWEHRESKWIAPEEIDNYSTVPKLKEALDEVLGNTNSSRK
jgi:nicotinamide-nucleotide amidase